MLSIRRIKLFNFVFAILLLGSCNSDENPSGGEWLIDSNQVLDGGPGKDGIPSVDNPDFISINEVDFLANDDLVILAKVGDDVKIYPHVILDWHEIVNDNVGGKALAITYCPLTGTAVAWDANVNGKNTTFGVSGLLYTTNLMPYDRESNSTWSQMRLDCVNGELIGTAIETFHLVETEWNIATSMFPDAQVLSTNTGFSRNYGQYPYGDYKTSNSVIFPLPNGLDTRIPSKERVLGIQEELGSLAFRFRDFNNFGIVSIQEDMVAGKSIVAFGSQAENFLVAFENDLNGEKVNFVAIPRDGQIVAADDSGNSYNVFGEIVEGPDSGAKLEEVSNYIGYWLGWSSFHLDIPISQ